MIDHIWTEVASPGRRGLTARGLSRRGELQSPVSGPFFRRKRRAIARRTLGRTDVPDPSLRTLQFSCSAGPYLRLAGSLEQMGACVMFSGGRQC